MSGSNGSVPVSSSPASMPRRSNWKLFVILLVCAAPVAASYFTYYVIRPAGAGTNYGQLIEPQRPLPQAAALAVTDLQGHPVDLQRVRGNWLLTMVEPSQCYESCRGKLYWMRQLKAAQGKDRDRIDRVWFVPDGGAVSSDLLSEYEGTVVLRASRAQLQAWLPAGDGTTIDDHLYLIDPMGNLMMRFPKNADANKIKADLGKLLRASASWQVPRAPSLPA
ncbi:MAG: hypothetical protein KGJ44_02285, partial [Betaproteobacteria bacterium]|nr:hypothetical protein [Betaproteobacteria bacterium]